MKKVYYVYDCSYEACSLFEDLFFASHVLARAELEVIFYDNKYENWNGYELVYDEAGMPSISNDFRTISIVEADVIDS